MPQSTAPSTSAPQGPKALVVPIDGPAQVINLPVNPAAMLSTLNEILHGYLEAVATRGGNWVCYINEEGKEIFRAERNVAADELVRSLGWKFLPGDYLVGPAVFLGHEQGNPDETDVPDSVLILARQKGILA